MGAAQWSRSRRLSTANLYRRQHNESRGACAAGPREPRRRADDSGARTLAQASGVMCRRQVR